MGDLQCAVDIVVARHGDAEYDEDTLSDSGGSLTPRGREQSRELADSLRGRRVALIYTSPMSRAVQSAEIAAAVLDVPVTVREELREYSVGHHAGEPDWTALGPVLDAWAQGDLATPVPGGESGSQIIDRVRSELEAIADLHRGETVLVVTHGGVMSLVLPWLVTNVAPQGAGRRLLPNASVVDLRADADGWVCTSWAGGTPG